MISDASVSGAKTLASFGFSVQIKSISSHWLPTADLIR